MKDTVENIFDKIQSTIPDSQPSKENPINVLEEVSKLFYEIEFTTQAELNKMVKKLVSKVPSNKLDIACQKLVDPNSLDFLNLKDPLLPEKVNVLLTISPALKHSDGFSNEVKRAVESTVYGVSVLLYHHVTPLREIICEHIRESHGSRTSLLVDFLTTATKIETKPFSEKEVINIMVGVTHGNPADILNDREKEKTSAKKLIAKLGHVDLSSRTYENLAGRALGRIDKPGKYSDLSFLKDFLIQEKSGKHLNRLLLDTVSSCFSTVNQLSFLLDLKINLSQTEEATLLKSAVNHETAKLNSPREYPILPADPPYEIFKTLLPLTQIGKKTIKMAQEENKDKSPEVIIELVLDAYLRSKVKHETELTNKINQHGRHNER